MMVLAKRIIIHFDDQSKQVTLPDKKKLINLRMGILGGNYNYHVFLTFCHGSVAKVSVSVDEVKGSF